jgi:hypothetical protein
MTRKHIRTPLGRNIVPTESHSDGQHACDFPRTLQTQPSSLGYGELPLFVQTQRLLHENSYMWHVHVIIYERSTTDHICRIHQVVVAFAPRWAFEGGMRDAA